MARVAQAIFFLGIAQKRCFNENRRHTLGFQNGKFGVFHGRLVQGAEFGQFREHFVPQLNAVAQFCFSEHIDDGAARLRRNIFEDRPADFVGSVLRLSKPACLQGGGATHAQRKDRGAVGLRLDPRIGVNAHEDVRLLLDCHGRAFVQRQEHVLGAGHHGTHAACAVDLRFKFLGDGQHHRFFVCFASLADGARILAAVAGIDDDHKCFGFAGLLGWFFLCDALGFRNGVWFALLALDFFGGFLIGARSCNDFTHRVGVGGFQIDDDAVSELSDGLRVVYVSAHVVLEIEDDTQDVGFELSGTDARDELVGAVEVLERLFDVSVQAQAFEVKHQSIGLLAAQHHVTVLELAVRFDRNTRAFIARPDAHLQPRGGKCLKRLRGNGADGAQNEFSTGGAHAQTSARIVRPRGVKALRVASRERFCTRSEISKSA